MKIEMKGGYISFQNTKEGDVITIADGGFMKPQKSKFTDKEELIAVFKVKHNEKDAEFSLYEKYKKPLIDAWGDESLSWVGKKFTIFHVNEKMEIRPVI